MAGLQRLTRAVDHYRAIVHERDGLTSSELAALAALADRGPLRGVDLGAVTGLTPGSITALVDRLAARGLLERHRPPDNKRVVAVALTSEGRQLLGRIHGPVHDMIAELVGCEVIDPATLHEELSVLASALSTLTPFSPASAADDVPHEDVPDDGRPRGGGPPTPTTSSTTPAPGP